MLCRTDNIRGGYPIFMEAISEEEEKKLNKDKEENDNISYTTKDGYEIENNNIIMFGELDLNKPKDIEIIEKYNLINDNGAHIHAKFNYDKGYFSLFNSGAGWYTTWNPLLWFKYCHCIIGKPKHIIVYKHSIKSKKRKNVGL